MSAELWGCFTWAPLPAGLSEVGGVWDTATPALSDADFSRRQQALRGAIGSITAQALAF